MHIPRSFAQKDSSELKDIIRKYPFAALITHSESGVEAQHLPFVVSTADGKHVIQAHIAKANKIWQSVKDGADVLVVFNGPNAYVSPNYYPTKKDNGKAVPTWNYVAVHVKGKISFIHDEQWVYQLLESLTSIHEADQDTPWSMADAPKPYIDKMLPAIVGIEVSIDTIEGQWKLSQNQPEVNKLGVVKGLENTTMAELIKAQI